MFHFHNLGTNNNNNSSNKREMDLLLEEMKMKSQGMKNRRKVQVELPKNALQHRFIDLVSHYVARCGHGFEDAIKSDLASGKVS